LQRLKETIRPYYLRWVYFPLHPQGRPTYFQDCWRYPFERLTESARLPESPSSLPDLLFYPMTDWHARIQRTQHLARAFAAMGYRVICLSPHLGREFESTPLFDSAHRLSRLENNVFELHVRLPREPVFHHRLLTAAEETIVADAIARALPKRGRAIQIASYPLWAGVASHFRRQAAFPVIYDCHDLLSGFRNVAVSLVDAEKDLLRDADLVLFSSQGLQDRYPSVRKSMLVRNAVNADWCQSPAPRSSSAAAVAGYVGALDSWFDIEAVERSAALYPGCRFILAGRIEFEPIRRLSQLPNVELAGEIPYQRVPEMLAQFGAALIPFRINPLTLMTNPIKLYEYFSCGLPVVSTPLPEAQAMGDLVYVGATPEEFARQVGRALEENDPERQATRREIARRESWDARARDIEAAFASWDLLPDKS
jgi:glycosyltransferase involved in cell wall biosynthesis